MQGITCKGNFWKSSGIEYAVVSVSRGLKLNSFEDLTKRIVKATEERTISILEEVIGSGT